MSTSSRRKGKRRRGTYLARATSQLAACNNRWTHISTSSPTSARAGANRSYPYPCPRGVQCSAVSECIQFRVHAEQSREGSVDVIGAASGEQVETSEVKSRVESKPSHTRRRHRLLSCHVTKGLGDENPSVSSGSNLDIERVGGLHPAYRAAQRSGVGFHVGVGRDKEGGSEGEKDIISGRFRDRAPSIAKYARPDPTKGKREQDTRR